MLGVFRRNRARVHRGGEAAFVESAWLFLSTASPRSLGNGVIVGVVGAAFFGRIGGASPMGGRRRPPSSQWPPTWLGIGPTRAIVKIRRRDAEIERAAVVAARRFHRGGDGGSRSASGCIGQSAGICFGACSSDSARAADDASERRLQQL